MNETTCTRGGGLIAVLTVSKVLRVVVVDLPQASIPLDQVALRAAQVDLTVLDRRDEHTTMSLS